MYDPSQEVCWALEELDEEGRVHALEKVRRVYSREWDLACLTPSQRKFYAGKGTESPQEVAPKGEGNG